MYIFVQTIVFYFMEWVFANGKEHYDKIEVIMYIVIKKVMRVTKLLSNFQIITIM